MKNTLVIFTLLLMLVSVVHTQTPRLLANGKIAFTSDRDGNREIYVMNPDGMNQVRLTNNLVLDDNPTWSPDGTRIAYVSQKPDGTYAIYVMNADGTNRTEITSLTTSAYTTWRPFSWSPNGRKIAFHDSTGHHWTGLDIFVVRTDGTGRQNLTADHEHLDITPTWSPDGSKILFSRYDLYGGYGGTMLHTIGADGGDPTPLANGFADGWNEDFPDWSPAANKIVYSVNIWDFHNDLYIANPDGTGRQFFHQCSTDWFALAPRFSPNGKTVVFECWQSYPSNLSTQIFSRNADGTELRQLTNTTGHNSSPSWQALPRIAAGSGQGERPVGE